MADVISSLCYALEKEIPKTWPDRGFSTPRGGIAESLESWIRDADARQLRQAVIRWTSLPSYGSSLCYKYLSLAVEIAYPCNIPEDLQQRLWQEDSISAVDAIVRHPSLWGDAEDVYPQGGASVEVIEDDTGREVLFVLSVPFSVILGR